MVKVPSNKVEHIVQNQKNNQEGKKITYMCSRDGNGAGPNPDRPRPTDQQWGEV